MSAKFETFYAASAARDARYDGRFLTAVTTTGIYCLPSCPAKKPLREHVRFFLAESDAQADGFRACRRCRPDAFYKNHDPDRERIESVVNALRKSPSVFRGVSDLARAADVSSSKLHELVRDHYHSTPASLLRRERVHFARERLLNSKLSLLDVSAESGFESASAFHDNFRRSTGVTPGDYRDLGRKNEFVVQLPAAFDVRVPLRILGRDPESLTERVDGTTAWKALYLDGTPALLEIAISGRSARCRVETAGKPSRAAMAEAHARALNLLGLTGDASGFDRRARSIETMREIVAKRPGLRIPQTASVFEGVAWSIVGQQVNLAFAYSLRRTFVELTGKRIGNLTVHPAAEDVAKLDYSELTGRKYSRSKAEYLIDTARLAAEEKLDFEALPSASATAAKERLLAVRGIGVWSANYIMMRACSFADCAPLGDTGLSSGLQDIFALEKRPTVAESDALMQQFRPYRSLTTFHLWMRKGDPA